MRNMSVAYKNAESILAIYKKAIQEKEMETINYILNNTSKLSYHFKNEKQDKEFLSLHISALELL